MHCNARSGHCKIGDHLMHRSRPHSARTKTAAPEVVVEVLGLPESASWPMILSIIQPYSPVKWGDETLNGSKSIASSYGGFRVLKSVS